MKLVTDVQFCQVLAERLNVSYIDLDNTELMPDIVKKIPEATARKYNVIAVSKIGKRMTVATNDPINFYIFEDLRVITGCSITPVLATKSSINRAIGKMYSEGQVNSVVDEATKQKRKSLTLKNSRISPRRESRTLLSLNLLPLSLRTPSVRMQRIYISSHSRIKPLSVSV